MKHWEQHSFIYKISQNNSNCVIACRVGFEKCPIPCKELIATYYLENFEISGIFQFQERGGTLKIFYFVYISYIIWNHCLLYIKFLIRGFLTFPIHVIFACFFLSNVILCLVKTSYSIFYQKVTWIAKTVLFYQSIQ